MGNLIENLGKTNSQEVSSLAKAMKELEASLKQQDRVVTSLCDKYEVVTSQLQMIEAGGRQSTEEQRSILQKARENVRAEALVVLNEKIKEEVDSLEDRLGKKIEEVDKKARGVEKKIETSKNESEEQKAQHEALAAKLEDLSKLVSELAQHSNKETKDEISTIFLIRRTKARTIEPQQVQRGRPEKGRFHDCAHRRQQEVIARQDRSAREVHLEHKGRDREDRNSDQTPEPSRGQLELDGGRPQPGEQNR
jgi:chromosome segregation ATPase